MAEQIGAKSTVCGGGRYNNLIESIGGKPCPAVGFGMGIERLLLTVEAEGITIPNEELPTVYVACMDTPDACLKLVCDLRAAGISASTDIMQRGLKAQMKYADKLGARYVVVVGDAELESGTVQVKYMRANYAEPCAIADLVDYFRAHP